MKEKTAVRIILTIFIITVGLLYYNNNFNEVTIYIANQNIAKDSKITDRHISGVTIRKDNMIPGVVTDKQKIIGKVASTNILKGDILTPNKLSGSIIDPSQKYVLRIGNNSNNSPGINTGSIVRVYLLIHNKKERYVDSYILMDSKIIQSKIGTDKTTGYTINVSNEELENYLIASKLGEIIMVRINDTSIPDIGENSPKFRIK
jgi:hypothetical protein